MLSQADKEYFLSLKQTDIDRNFFESHFGNHYNPETKKMEKPRFELTTEFNLKKGEYTNQTDVLTNIGLFVFNKYIREDLLEPVMDYWNTPFDNKTFSKFEGAVASGLMKDIITMKEYGEYQNRLQWILSLHTLLVGSFTEAFLRPNKNIINLRDKLLKKHKDAIENGDTIQVLKIEKELLEKAKEELKNDPGMELIDSGARGNFDNNYKSNMIMKGPIYDPVTGNYRIATSSFAEGIKKENFPEFASSVTAGVYPKSVGTAVGGYTVKKFYAEYQSIVLGPKGSDCHSKRTLEILLTEDNYKKYIDRYILNGSKILLLNDDNIKQFIGKKIKLRSPMFCTSDNMCNVCFGDLPYKIGVKNVGLTAAKIGSIFVNLGMKSFHDTSLKLNEVNPDDILL